MVERYPDKIEVLGSIPSMPTLDFVSELRALQNEKFIVPDFSAGGPFLLIRLEAVRRLQ